MHQCARHRDALQFAARQLARRRLAALAEADRRQQFHRACVALGGIDAEQHQRQLDVLRDGQMRQDVEGLEDEADLVPPQAGAGVLVEPRDVLAADDDAAGVRRIEAGDQVQQGGLAGARLADHGDVLAGGQFEIERIEDRPRAEAPGEALDRQHGAHCRQPFE